MQNQAMARALKKRECVDVSDCEQTTTGDYILPFFTDGKDYCDAKAETWIWSIGRLNCDLASVMANGDRRMLLKGTILASPTGKWYQNPVAECL